MQSDAIRHKDLQSWIPRQARYDICESPDYDRVLTLPQARQSVVVIPLKSGIQKNNQECPLLLTYNLRELEADK